MTAPYTIQRVIIEGSDGHTYEVTADSFTSIGAHGGWDGRIYPHGQVPEAVAWAREDLFAKGGAA
jgi:hypothetical protein